MASACQAVLFLVLVLGLFAEYSYQANVRKICIKCVNGRDCEDQTCAPNQDTCATVRGKDDVVVLQECVESEECTELTDNARTLRSQLRHLNPAQKAFFNAILASAMPDTYQVMKRAGLSLDIEELSHYKCETCDGNKCNVAPTENDLIA